MIEAGKSLLRKTVEITATLNQVDGIKMLDKLVELGLKVEDEKPDERGKTLLMAAVELSLGAYQNKNLIAHWLLAREGRRCVVGL
ncbi:hypothetical protein [Leptospira kirschneri]|uniref:hypothetical protein n=1 Tax=Leptospira kirschneri TaxID=29507 RepID=UPI00046C58E0|nr:hypothetical protein [Leptospira kirschneri]